MFEVMLKVLKFNHITLNGGDFDEILVADDRLPSGECACDLCIFKDTPTADCAFIHGCGATIGYMNTYWLLGACTCHPDGEANPNGRHVDV